MASSTTRNILIVVFVALAVLAVGVFMLGRNLNGIVAGLIESQGSAVTGTAVSVQGVDIKLSEARATISGLSIANPQGFAGNALDLGQFTVQLDARSLTSDTIVIKDIAVAETHLNVLQEGPRNNLQELLANLQSDQPAEEPPADEGAGKLLIIDHLKLNNVGASVSIADLDEQREVTLKELELRDIGRATNGATAAQVAKQVLRPLLETAIASAAAQSMKDRATEAVNEAVGGFLKKLNKDDE